MTINIKYKLIFTLFIVIKAKKIKCVNFIDLSCMNEITSCIYSWHTRFVVTKHKDIYRSTRERAILAVKTSES